MGARLVTIQVGPLQANCHFVYDQDKGSGFLVDPGGDAPDILKMVETAGVRMAGILLTHGHSDHLAATAEVAGATGAGIYGSSEARDVLADPDRHIIFPGMPSFAPARLDHLISGGEEIALDGFDVKAIATPGHTPGSVTFFANGALFSGDLLFRGSIGRTDLSGGSFEELAASVRKLILVYPPDTVVYPGHGSSTTLERERETNPFLTDLGW